MTPNLCNDGHDADCVGPNVEGGHAGGLVGANLWLKHWMPMILASPAYRNGKMLVVLTFDESGLRDARAARPPTRPTAMRRRPKRLELRLQPRPRAVRLADDAPAANVYPGGGQVGAVLFNRLFIEPGSINTTGVYNHYSALRSYEDLLGITAGGDDGFGHLGFAARPGTRPFGGDVFNAWPRSSSPSPK